MGKNKRTKHFARERLLREQEQVKKAKAQRKKTTKKIFLISLVVLLILAILVVPTTLLLFARRNSGNSMRNTIVAESENFQVNGAMFTFHFYDTLMKTVSANLHDYTHFGLSLDANLRRTRDPRTGLTWFDYFMARALDSMEDILTFAQAAYDADVTLTDHDRQTIDNIIAEKHMQSQVRRLSFDVFVGERFGWGVNEQDIRDYLEIYFLHQRMFQYVIAEIDITSEAASSWFYQNQENFMFVDVVSIDIGFPWIWIESIPSFDSLSEQEQSVLLADRYALAQTFGAASTLQEFEEMATEYFRQLHQREGLPFSPADALEHLDMINDTFVLSDRNSDPLHDWMYSDQREEGDFFILKSEITGVVAVYYIVNPLHRLEQPTHNVREIFINSLDFPSHGDAEDYARALWNSWQNGDQTESRFSSLAQSRNRNTYLAARSGLRINLRWHDDNESNPLFYVINWAYGSNISVGDSTFIPTNDGFHILFYVGEGFPVWQAQAEENLLRRERWEIIQSYSQRFVPTIHERSAARHVARLR